MTDDNYDVVIVGAGISGLVAAKEILQTSQSLKVLVVEAKDRVGGRTETVNVGTERGTDRLDIGGQWVGRTQYHILALLQELQNGAGSVSAELLSLVMDKLENNAAVVLSTAVIAADTTDQHVTLTLMKTDDERQISSVRCKRVIFAIPPNQLVPIEFRPRLPYYRQQICQFAPLGNLVKFLATYKTAFWRDAGLSGEIAATGLTQERGQVLPILTTFDGTTDSGSPALVGFLHNEWADVQMEERRAAVINDLARYFGSEALDYIDYADRSWSGVPYSGGCPSAVLPPGAMQHFCKCRYIDDKFHYAGTETATHWPGYMDGAVQSGKRAAKEVLLLLDPNCGLTADQMEHGSTLHPEFERPCEQDTSYPVPSTIYYKSVAVVAVVVIAVIAKSDLFTWIWSLL